MARGEDLPTDDGLGPVGRPASARSLGSRLRAVYGSRVGSTERLLLASWSSFAVTFGAVRALTHLLKGGRGMTSGGIVIHGRHLHHYNIGIALLVAVGGIVLHGDQRRRRHPVTAAAYGSGIALIVDELALLIDLQDVYWAKEGRTSVDVAVGTIGLGGVYLAAVPFWRDVARELARTRRAR